MLIIANLSYEGFQFKMEIYDFLKSILPQLKEGMLLKKREGKIVYYSFPSVEIKKLEPVVETPKDLVVVINSIQRL